MKTFIFLLVLFVSSASQACSCSYDYSRNSQKILGRAALLLEIDTKNIDVVDYEPRLTPLALLEPANHSECGCPLYVKRVWEITYNKENELCTARIVVPVWNDRLTVKNISCQ